MPEWLQILACLIGGLVLLWLVLIAVLVVQQRRMGRDVNWKALARLGPDVARLIHRLATDRMVPRGTRWLLLALLIYLLLPIDLVPDFIPVIGYADDAIIAAFALRYAIKNAGYPALQRNWPGTREGLHTVLTLARIKAPPDDAT